MAHNEPVSPRLPQQHFPSSRKYTRHDDDDLLFSALLLRSTVAIVFDCFTHTPPDAGMRRTLLTFHFAMIPPSFLCRFLLGRT